MRPAKGVAGSAKNGGGMKYAGQVSSVRSRPRCPHLASPRKGTESNTRSVRTRGIHSKEHEQGRDLRPFCGSDDARQTERCWQPGSRRRRRAGRGAGPGGDVVGGRDRHPSRSRTTSGSGSRSWPTTWTWAGSPPTGSRTSRATASGTSRSRRRPSASGSITARWPSARQVETGYSAYQDTIVRPNLPDRTESSGPAGRRRPRAWSATG